MNYTDLIYARNEFKNRKDFFLELNATFFLNLINQVYEKGNIPQGMMLKFKAGTDENINIAEEWLSIDENGYCNMEIGIEIEGNWHRIYFQTEKKGNELGLTVTIENNSKTFDFDVSTKEKIEDIFFSDVVDYIFTELVEIYNQWKF